MTDLQFGVRRPQFERTRSLTPTPRQGVLKADMRSDLRQLKFRIQILAMIAMTQCS